MPLVIPFADYEGGIQHGFRRDSDGQYKAQVLFHETETDLYIARAGTFNVEGNFGWNILDLLVDGSRLTNVPTFRIRRSRHSSALLGSIKGLKCGSHRATEAH